MSKTVTCAAKNPRANRQSGQSISPGNRFSTGAIPEPSSMGRGGSSGPGSVNRLEVLIGVIFSHVTCALIK